MAFHVGNGEFGTVLEGTQDSSCTEDPPAILRDGVADVSEKADTHGTVPVKVKYPKILGETKIDRNKRIRILKKKALDPEQLKEHKRKNLVWLHKHREKNKKIRYPQPEQ